MVGCKHQQQHSITVILQEITCEAVKRKQTWLELDGTAPGEEGGDDAGQTLNCHLHAVLYQVQNVQQLRSLLELTSFQLLLEPATTSGQDRI